MNRFATLLDRLVYTPSRNAKLRLLGDYFAGTADPDRGWALAALTGGLTFPNVKAGHIRALIAERTDGTLYALSYDYVGDLAETCALLWPGSDRPAAAPELRDVVGLLQATSRADAADALAGLLDTLDANGRWALLKLITGGLRIGVSARLAKTALAEAFGKPVHEIEEVWHGVEPPYREFFGWLGGGARPAIDDRPTFRPFMLAHPLDDDSVLDPAAWAVEWKWDGIRVQFVSRCGEKRLYSRAGDDISAAFPDLIAALEFDGVLDGELLIRGEDGGPAPFNRLQQRLNRKTVSRRMMAEHPAYLCAYDILFDGASDVRAEPLSRRRQRLEELFARHAAAADRLTVSEILPVRAWRDIAALQAEARRLGREGLMLKRRDSAYEAGRTKGNWFKWKRDPLSADAVLMYAQRGHGRRSSFYSDYTFGVWRGDDLVPVGKAYFGFTDEELRQLDKWVRDHSIARFGPVREVEKGLVFEVAFDSIHASPRHKSGLAMRFPRIARIRWDKPAAEADRLETLEKLAES